MVFKSNPLFGALFVFQYERTLISGTTPFHRRAILGKKIVSALLSLPFVFSPSTLLMQLQPAVPTSHLSLASAITDTLFVMRKLASAEAA